MDFMDAQHIEYVGFALFVLSELIGMSKYKSNSVLQLLLAAAVRAFPYSPKPRGGAGPLDVIFGIKKQDRR
jgi:hypothetical protein